MFTTFNPVHQWGNRGMDAERLPTASLTGLLRRVAAGQEKRASRKFPKKTYVEGH
jgi:hypothetical protein